MQVRRTNRKKRSLKNKQHLFKFIKKYRTLKDRKHNLKHATKNDLQNISTVFRSFIKGQYPLSAKDVKKLKKHKQTLANFLKQKKIHKKRDYLVQRGGQIFSILLPAALSLLSTLLHK
jgi:phosphopantetheine adenylyltransferase